MKILMLVNWKVDYNDDNANGKQPPDYYSLKETYWFFRYFVKKPEVDVIDIRSFSWLEKFEKNKLRFYVWQTMKAIPKLKKYDLIISHGMQSAVVLSLFRRFVKTKAKHLVFEIGSFNSAATSGFALKLMQFASKSIEGFIYHTSKQIEYYKEYFPWIVPKTYFMCYGADTSFFIPYPCEEEMGKRILCVGYHKRDWETLLEAYRVLKKKYGNWEGNISLKLIGKDKFDLDDESISCQGYIPIESLKDEIAKASICVVPLEDFNYSFGQMTLLQQMAMKKPIIVAKVPSMMDYVKDGETALYYKAGDCISLAQQMNELLKNSSLCERLAENAFLSVKSFYNEERMAADIEKVIDSIMK